MQLERKQYAQGTTVHYCLSELESTQKKSLNTERKKQSFELICTKYIPCPLRGEEEK